MAKDDRVGTSDEEEEEEEDDEDEGQGINMMNFMFGNVDSHGELEGDFLDEVLAAAHCLCDLHTWKAKCCCAGGQAEPRWSPERKSWSGPVGEQHLEVKQRCLLLHCKYNRSCPLCLSTCQ